MAVRHVLIAAAILWLGALASPAPAAAQSAEPGGPAPDGQQPILFKADNLRYERDTEIIVATGNVEFATATRILLADTVSYNRRADQVTATGNISLVEPSGDVLFADYMELSGDLRDGIVRSIKVRLTDDARIAATGGRRIGGVRTEMRKAVYSPCDLCKDNPERSPLWQVKAYEIVHDQEAHDIEYRDAFLEIYGLPVAYVPYFSHPDPTVKRRSGFLAPTYGNDTELGFTVNVPYYFNIAPDKDATFSPTFTSNEGPVLWGEYRQRFANGEMTVQGAITQGSTQTSESETRGYLLGVGRVDLDDNWRAGTDFQFASDDTFKRRYNFGGEDTLTSRAYGEYFRGRQYGSIQGYYFQGLRVEDDSGQSPIVLPLLDYNYVGTPGRRGGQLTFDANFMALTRTEGTDSRRLSLKPGWHLPYTSSLGERYNFYATLQSDLYMVDEVSDSNIPGKSFSGPTGRIFPQVGLDWRLPFIRRDRGFSHVITPVAGIVASPDYKNPDKIPNEDSQDLEIDDTNIFSANRNTGLDRVEGGVRVNYGLSTTIMGHGSGYTSAFLGQSYRLVGSEDYSVGSGLEDDQSDIVGRVQVSPGKYLDLTYRFRAATDSFTARRNELSGWAGVSAFQVSANYLFIGQRSSNNEIQDRQQLSATVASQLTKRWRASASTLIDLSDGASALAHGARLIYEDECFIFDLEFRRSLTRDRDVEPSDTIYLRLNFKTLGAFESSSGG